MAIDLAVEEVSSKEKEVGSKEKEVGSKEKQELPDVEQLLSELVETTPELKPPPGKEKWFDRFSTYEEAEQAYKKLQTDLDNLKKQSAEFAENAKKLEEYKPILDALERNPDIVKVLLDRAAGINTPVPTGTEGDNGEVDFMTDPDKAVDRLLSKKLSGLQTVIAQAVDKAVSERLQKLSEAQSVIQSFRSTHPEIGDAQLTEIARYAQANNLSLEDAYTRLQEMAKKVLEGWGLTPAKKTSVSTQPPSMGREVNLSKLSQALASEGKDDVLSTFADMLLGGSVRQ